MWAKAEEAVSDPAVAQFAAAAVYERGVSISGFSGLWNLFIEHILPIGSTSQLERCGFIPTFPMTVRAATLRMSDVLTTSTYK